MVQFTQDWSQGNAILSKFPIISSKITLIKDPITPRKHFSDEGRTYVEATLKITNSFLKVGTTHMSYTDRFQETKEKIKESDKLIDEISKKNKLYVLTGDFNSPEESYIISNLNERLVNLGPDYHEKTRTTKPFSYNGFSEDNLNWRLDFVFGTKDIKVISSEIIKIELSDHLPILIKIEIPEN